MLLRYGIGRLRGLPSIIGLGHPPALASKPFLLKITLIISLTNFELNAGKLTWCRLH